MSFGVTKDLNDPKYANDKDVNEYKAFMAKYLPGKNIKNLFFSYAYSSVMLFKHVIEKAGDNLTRENVMKIATNLEFQMPLFLPGIKFKSTPDNYFGIASFQPVFFRGDLWRVEGDRINVN